MIVKKIEWLSKEAKEALLYITIGKNNIVVFSHPCNIVVGEDCIDKLYSLNANNIKVSDSEVFSIDQTVNKLGCSIIGKIIDKKNSIILVHDISIELDMDIPNDIIEDEFIELSCDRIDVY